MGRGGGKGGGGMRKGKLKFDFTSDHVGVRSFHRLAIWTTNKNTGERELTALSVAGPNVIRRFTDVIYKCS